MFFVLYYKISIGLGWEQKWNVRAEGLNPHPIVPVKSAHRILELPCSWTHLFPIISNIFKYKALGQNSASKLSSCLSFFCQTLAPLGPGKLARAVLSFFHPRCTPSFGLGFLSFSFFSFFFKGNRSSAVKLLSTAAPQSVNAPQPPEHDPLQAASQILSSGKFFHRSHISSLRRATGSAL